ncbi:MAG TPA: hypothetical protein VMZ27_04865 [Candidatus Saccharimonadales bacterium]|nr:hypothetical protein [Candidatus Saccharimonadales bacterium]
MKRIKQLMLLAGVAGLLSFGAGNAAAQGRGGNFDPEQFRQRMMDNYKEQLEVKSDDEWKIISARIEKVMTAQREARVGRSGFGGGQRRNRGGDNNAATDTNTQRNRNPFGGEPNPDVEALQKSIDAKASNDELKAKLAKARQNIKEKEAAVTSAQDDLKKVLSVRQEAIAVTIGLLK